MKAKTLGDRVVLAPHAHPARSTYACFGWGSRVAQSAEVVMPKALRW